MKIGSSATTSDSYQIVTAAGLQQIDLSALTGGAVVPQDGDTVHFTVVAYDAAGNESTPSADSKANVQWDKAAPQNPDDISLIDNNSSNSYGTDSMYLLWDSNRNPYDNPDFDHYVIYLNVGVSATPSSYKWSKTWTDSVTETNLRNIPGFSLNTAEVNEGDEVYVSIYSVDKYGNMSDAVSTNATYTEQN
ncbi:hypothetical protein [Peribacillus asahii]|uniref:hypothetical protein n=1 Tax=Peribacillus asahii TaxID=228899 RepID=UPI00380A7F38